MKNLLKGRMVGFHVPLKKLWSFVEKPFSLRSVRTVFNRLLQHKCLGIEKPPTCLTKQAMRALPMTAPFNRVTKHLPDAGEKIC